VRPGLFLFVYWVCHAERHIGHLHNAETNSGGEDIRCVWDVEPIREYEQRHRIEEIRVN